MEETNNTTPQPTTAYGSNGGAADSYFAVPGDSTGSGSGSLQNDGFLSSGGGGDGSGYDAEFGFQRPEFLTEKLAGTVQVFDRHIFLCYKTPHVWPPQVEAAEFDRLPRLLSAAVKARRGDMKKLTRLTICEGEDGTESSNGDVLFFPDMIRYSRLTHFDVDTFVEETLVKDIEWMPGTPEKLTGSYVFVCAHGSRDRRCGVCGPPLIKKFKEEINIRGLQDKVFVSPCSHIGGHKYAGNVIIFSRMGDDGEVKGNWYGYVSPDDVPALLDQHIAAGEILPHLWRGQMGMSKEEHKKTYELWFQANEGIKKSEQGAKDSQSETVFDVPNTSIVGCCGGSNNSSCCQTQDFKPEEKLHDDANLDAVNSPKATAAKNSSKGAASNSKKTCAMSTWFECWEREDTYAALAVIAAAATVTFAYGCYKHLSQDSVYQVSETAFESCDVSNPILKMTDGNSVFNLTEAGVYYFTSGVHDRCGKKQKMAVTIMSGNGTVGSETAVSPSASSSSFPAVFGPMPPASPSSPNIDAGSRRAALVIGVVMVVVLLAAGI